MEKDGKVKGKEYIYEERNGKVFYFPGKLLFEGEYLNDNKNGKGKEYFDGRLMFEGEYLDDLKHGKGKQYYENGKLLFEGEYLNDLKWNGKGYNLNHYLAYELKDGKGKMKEIIYVKNIILLVNYFLKVNI